MLRLILLLFCTCSCAISAPIVTPINGEQQTAVSPNPITLSFNVTPPVPPENISWYFQNGPGQAQSTLNPGTDPFIELSVDRLSLHILVTTMEGIYTLYAVGPDGTGTGSIALDLRSEPAFLKVPISQIKHERENVTFTCFATGDPTPTIDWIYNHSTIVDTSNTNKYAIGPFGADDFGSLTILDLNYEDNGYYTCRATNQFTSRNATSVQLQIQVFPILDKQPVNMLQPTAGGIAYLTCIVRGFPPVTITWQKNGTNETDIQGAVVTYSSSATYNHSTLAVTSILTLKGPVLSTNGNYTCTASNYLKTFESAMSTIAQVNTQYPPSTSVSDSIIIVNQTFSTNFTCWSFGIPTPALSWYKDGRPVTSDGNLVITRSSFVNSSQLTIRTIELSILSAVRTNHEDNYTCVAINDVTNLILTPENVTTELLVQVPPTLEFNHPQPVLGLVNKSVTITFTILNASPDVTPPNIHWEFSFSQGNISIPINVSSPRYEFSLDRRSLTITSCTHNDEGIYRITVSNEAGITSLSANLSIKAAPVITIPPVDTNSLEGTNVTLSCTVTGEPQPVIGWYIDGNPVNQSISKYTITLTDGSMEREYISQLVTSSLEMVDTANYTCSASNIYGITNRTIHVEVQIRPIITTQPVMSIGIRYGGLVLTCSAFGSPLPDIKWIKDNVTIASTDVIAVESTVDQFVRNSSLIFTNLTFLDAGFYTCQAENNLVLSTITNSSTIEMIVNQSPVFDDLIALDVVNQTQTINMTCVFLGLPPPVVTWSRTGTNISLVTNKYTQYTVNTSPIDGGVLTHSTLQISDVDERDTDSYTCTAVNKAHGPSTNDNITYHTFSLLVQTSPIVTRLSASLEIGVKTRNITLSFVVSRDVPSIVPGNIEWFLNNGVISGNDSRFIFSSNRLSLTIVNLTLADEGNYTLTATNIIGKGMDQLYLDVEIAPVITNNSGIIRVVKGTNATISCQAISEPIHFTSWSFRRTNLINSDKYVIVGNGTIASSLTILDVDINDEGNYTCHVSNVHDVDFARSLLQVQVPPNITEGPISGSVLVNNKIILTCCATGHPSPDIHWRLDNQFINMTQNDRLDTMRWSLGANHICSNLTISNAVFTDGGMYSCVAVNVLAEVLKATSSDSLLVVLYPPEVFPLSQSVYVKNQSDTFTVECHVFGIPPPSIYWLPGPFNVTTNIGDRNNQLSSSEVTNLMSLLENFNRSRYINTSSLCHHAEYENNTCSVVESNDCRLSGSLCSVPCGVSITSANGTDSMDRPTVVSTLTLCGIRKSDELSYTCVAVNNITNDIGSTEGVSLNLIIQVIPVIPSIADTKVAFRDHNTTLSFNIYDASPDVMAGDITWTFKSERSSLVVTIPDDNPHYSFSSDRRSLTIHTLSTNDTGIYTISGSNPAGYDTGDISLNVQALPEIILFTNGPIRKYSGSDITLDCFADGSPLQNVTWTFTNTSRFQLFTIQYLITNDMNRTGHIVYSPLVDYVNRSMISEHFTINDNTNPVDRLYGQLIITNITVYQAGSYRCTLANIYDTETQSVQVEVQLNVSVISNPDGVTCVAGGLCNLTCTMGGVPFPNVSWHHDGTLVNDSFVSNINQYDQSHSILNIGHTRLAHAGLYHCFGVNKLISQSVRNTTAVELTVHYPPEVQIPLLHSIVNETFNVTLHCTIAGNPQPQIQWYFNESMPISDGSKYIINTNSVMAGVLHNVTSTLTITYSSKSNEGQYTCTGSNDIINLIGTTSTSTAMVTVQVPPMVVAIPLTTSTKIKGSNNVVINFNILRSSPEVQLSDIRWSFISIQMGANEVTLNTSCAGVNSTCYVNTTCSDTVYQRYNFSSDLRNLTINNLTVNDYGTYKLTATNPAGVHYAEFELIVYVPAAITNASGYTSDVSIGQNVSFSCTADGIPRPGIIWFFNSAAIISLPRVDNIDKNDDSFRCDVGLQSTQNGFTSVLTITNVDANNEGTYVCQAESPGSEPARLETPFRLNIDDGIVDHCANSACREGSTCINQKNGYQCQCPSGFTGELCNTETPANVRPTFGMQPKDRYFVRLFDPVELPCSASGIPDPRITWSFNNEPLAGESSLNDHPLKILETTLDRRGWYRCHASNSEGTITSDPITLVNIDDVVEYTATLNIPFNTILDRDNLTVAAGKIVNTINSRISGSRVGTNSTFFFIELAGAPRNSSMDNFTVPIRVTIRVQLGVDEIDERLRNIVEGAVREFGFSLELGSSVQRFNYCPPDVTRLPSPDGNTELDIVINWRDTLLGKTQIVECPCDFNLSETNLVAIRECNGTSTTRAQWLPANVTACDFSVTTRRLCQLASLNTSSELLNGLDNITRAVTNIDSSGTTVASVAIQRIRDDAARNSTLANNSLNVYDNLLRVNQTVLREAQLSSQSSSRLLDSLDQIITGLPNNTKIIKDTLTVTTTTSTSSDINLSLINITVPPQLQNRASTLVEYSSTGLFISPNPDLQIRTNVTDFSAVSNSNLSAGNRLELSIPVEISFNVPSANNSDENGFLDGGGRIRCKFWDVKVDDWSEEGCNTTINATGRNVICSCNHLTGFAVLLDVRADKPPPQAEREAFTYITYIGLVVSVVCLIITLITYLGSPKLRRSEASHLLINLCFAFIGLYVTFFFATFGWQLTHPLCALIGAVLQYFFLVVFFIMAAESIDLFIKLVIVLGPKIHQFITKAIIVCWVAPVFFVVLSFAPNYQYYVNEHYCGPTNIPQYVGMLMPFGVIYIFNMTIFFIITVTLIRKSTSSKFTEVKKRNRKAEFKQQCRVAFTVAVLFGLGWGFGLLATQAIEVQAIRVIFHTLFTVCTVFQGMIIFCLYVAFSPNARSVWKKWILRKEGKPSTESSTSQAGTSKSHSTKQTTASITSSITSKGPQSRQRGTLYDNVKKTSKSKLDDEFVSIEREVSSVSDANQPLVDELKEALKRRDKKEKNVNMEPLGDELGEVTSLLSDNSSLCEDTTISLPNPNPLSLEDEGDTESINIENEDTTTFRNPFMSSRPSVRGLPRPINMEEMQLLSQSTINEGEYSNHGISIDIITNGNGLNGVGLSSETEFTANSQNELI